MDIIKQIREKAAKLSKTIVLPRSSDERVVQAAEFLTDQNLCKVILIENKESKNLPARIEVINPINSNRREAYADVLYQQRKHKGLTEVQALELINDPLYFAAAMVAAGDADGGVAGSVSTTGDVLRAAIQTVGLKKGSNIVSSIFLMNFDDGRVYTYGDCAVVPYPSAAQLATIAIDSAQTHLKLTGLEPKVAMLSFSSKGSAEHERVDLVREALAIAQKQEPDLSIDGELQFDAAVIEDIGKRKAPNSKVAGKANVFIFPNLDAGNISYKITERLGGATATGPIIQGLAKPMMDLSRGCSWEDIVNAVCVCALMADGD